MGDLSTVITAFAALITAIGVLVAAWGNRRQIHEVKNEVVAVKNEVKTANAQTIAQLADAIETRRIEAVSEPDWTTSEREHMDALRSDTQREER